MFQAIYDILTGTYWLLADVSAMLNGNVSVIIGLTADLLDAIGGVLAALGDIL